MLLHQIEALVEVGVAHVVLAVSYHAEQLEQEMQALNVGGHIHYLPHKKYSSRFIQRHIIMGNRGCV